MAGILLRGCRILDLRCAPADVTFDQNKQSKRGERQAMALIQSVPGDPGMATPSGSEAVSAKRCSQGRAALRAAADAGLSVQLSRTAPALALPA